MKKDANKLSQGLLAACLLATLLIPSTRAQEAGSLDGAIKYLRQYAWSQSVAPLAPIEKAITGSGATDATRLKVETALSGILASDASRAAKDFACRKLARIGTSKSVPPLETLLPDAELSDMARYALERIGNEAARNVLRKAVASLKGKQQVGAVNSLGMLRDKDAVEAISALLPSIDYPLVSSAVMALGRIGSKDCVAPLLTFEKTAQAPLKGVYANALLSLGEARRDAGDVATAMRIYRQLYAVGNPPHIRAGAFRGLVMADPQKGTERILEVLRSGDSGVAPHIRGLVLQMRNPGTARRLANGLATLPADRQVSLLKALSAKGDAEARDAVRKAADHETLPVRVASLEALGRVGTADDVAFLATRATAGDPAEQVAAEHSLSVLRGAEVNQRIVAETKTAKAPVRATLLASLAIRDARETVQHVVAYLSDGEGRVRTAALETLGALGAAEEVAPVFKHLKAATDGSERKAAESALDGIAARGDEAGSKVLAKAMDGADDATRKVLVRALGKAGCKTALETIVETVKSNEALADEAIRVLSGWQNADAAPHLLQVAKTDKKLSRKVLALRGYVRLIGASKTIKDSDKVKRLSEAMAVAPRVDEKKLVLGAYAGIATASSLAKVLPLVGDEGVGDEAANAAVRIADKLVKKDKAGVRDAMKQVVEKTRNDKIRKSARGLLKKAGG